MAAQTWPAHAALALVACIFAGMNVLLQWALGAAPASATSVRGQIGRSVAFALYRDVGAAAVLACVAAIGRRVDWRLLRRDADGAATLARDLGHERVYRGHAVQRHRPDRPGTRQGFKKL